MQITGCTFYIHNEGTDYVVSQTSDHVKGFRITQSGSWDYLGDRWMKETLTPNMAVTVLMKLLEDEDGLVRLFQPKPKEA